MCETVGTVVLQHLCLALGLSEQLSVCIHVEMELAFSKCSILQFVPKELPWALKPAGIESQLPTSVCLSGKQGEGQNVSA